MGKRKTLGTPARRTPPQGRARGGADIRFQRLIRLSRGFYWESDSAHRFTLNVHGPMYVSMQAPDSQIGKTRWEIPSTRPDAAGWEAHKAALDAHLAFRDFEFARVGPDGAERQFVVSGEPVFDAEGRFTGYCGIGDDVTERKRTEEALRMAEERYRTLVELSPDGIVLHEMGIIQYANASAVKLFGADSPDALLGRSLYDLIDPQYREAARQRAIALQQGVTALPLVERKYLRLDGTPITVEVAGAAIRSGGKALVQVVMRDISARKRGEQLLALEHAVNRCLAGADSVAAAMKAVMRSVCEMQGWECGRYFRVDDEAGVLRFDEFWSMPEAKLDGFIARSRAVSYTPGEGLIGRTWQSGEALWVPDIASDPRATQRIGQDTGLRGAFLFPVVAEGKVIGVLGFNSRQVREPDERLLVTARVIGSQIGQFLQRKQAEEALREAEERSRSLLMASPNGIWIHRNRRVEYVNSKLVTMFGYENAEEIVGREIYEMLPPEHHEAVRVRLEQLETERRAMPLREFVMLKRDGTAFDAEVAISSFRQKDAVWIITVIRDITERKRAERLLALEHTVNRCLADADNASEALKAVIGAVCESENWASGRYFRVDEEAGVLRFAEFWSVPGGGVEKFITRLGGVVFKPGVGLAGRVWQTGQPLWSADINRDDRAIQASFIPESGISGAFVFPVKSEGKTIGVLAFNSSEIREPDERLLQAVGVIGSQIGQFLRRKHAEESQRRFRAATDLSADMIILVDRATMRFIDVNITACEELGYTREELLQMGPHDLNRIPREEYERAYDRLIAGQQEARVLETALRRSDGSMIPVEVNRGVVKTGNGHLIIATVRNISRRKRNEAALRESEERFRSLSGLSSDRFWEQDDQYRFTSLTGAGSQVYGQTAQLLVGKTRWELNYVNMTAEDWAAHIATLEARRPFRDLELCRLDENGKKVWVSVSGEPVFDPSGTFTGYRGVGKDIAERKQDEERIQHLASHDALTSLPNRVLFSEVLNMAIQSAQRNNRKFAMLFIDLDRFKVINDTLGHAAGDKLLREMGARIKETLRTSDIVARLGGDEFVVLVQEVGEAAQVETVARKILSTLIKPMVISGQECRVSASIGICMYPADAQEEQSLMKHADTAMYWAKQSGGNGYRFFAGQSADSTTRDAGP